MDFEKFSPHSKNFSKIWNTNSNTFLTPNQKFSRLDLDPSRIWHQFWDGTKNGIFSYSHLVDPLTKMTKISQFWSKFHKILQNLVNFLSFFSQCSLARTFIFREKHTIWWKFKAGCNEGGTFFAINFCPLFSEGSKSDTFGCFWWFFSFLSGL